MTVVKELFQFQLLESQVDQARKRLTEMANLLQEGPELVAARHALAQLEKERADLQTEARSLELDAETTQSRHDTLDKRMMGNEVTNPRDLEAVQREITNLEERRGTMEDQVLGLLDKIEQAAQAAAQQSSSVDVLGAAWRESQADLLREKEKIESDMPLAEQRVKKQASSLEAPARSIYDRVKAKKGTMPVARVEGGICTGCRITLPIMLVSRARAGKDLVLCSSCGRVLYVE